MSKERGDEIMDDQLTSKTKHGTTTIGLVCKEGIVLASEKRATTGTFVADKKSEKIFKITDNLAITTAGTVSDAQLLTKLIRAELKLKEVRTDRGTTAREAANLLGSLIYGNIRKYSLIPGITQFLLAGSDREGFHLYDLFVDGSVMECDEYVSSGSGSIIVYGVLEAMYKKDLTVKEGVDLCVKCLNVAIQRDIASGNGIVVYTITKEGIKKVIDRDLETTLKQ
ncbi:proteasome subunit beta [Candidatus Woesearchaeota archaeon]|nr:proteasome subunit beta [Candidatus Woesearchaeota archaeon]